MSTDLQRRDEPQIATPVEVQAIPYNAETPMQLLAAPRTPTAAFYVRNHNGMPGLDSSDYRLRIGGHVETPMSLTIEELRKLPVERAIITMECAGNGRSSMRPTPPGVPWRLGAVGTAEFSGISLRSILERARVRTGAVDVVLTGADQGAVNGREGVSYQRSVPLTEAMSAQVMLAWEMNGEPLTIAHGFPMRVVVPRWYAMSSVKWLTQIDVIDRPFEGYWQANQYRYVNEAGTPEEMAVTQMRVRSVIARPGDGERLSRAPMEIAGTAWSGEGAIDRVEFSADGGSTWADARLVQPESAWAATPWRFDWMPPQSGSFALISRATDAAGNTQPITPRRNAMGYGNNCVQQIVIEVHN